MRKIILLFLYFFFFITSVVAQQTLLKGVVTDSLSGERLPSAALLWKGTTLGCATDLDGQFSFYVPNGNGTLQVSFIGYDTQEIALSLKGQPIQLNFQLKPSSIDLSEVVVKPKRERYR